MKRSFEQNVSSVYDFFALLRFVLTIAMVWTGTTVEATYVRPVEGRP